MSCHGLHVWSLYIGAEACPMATRAPGLAFPIIEMLQGQLNKLQTSFCPLWSLNRHLRTVRDRGDGPSLTRGALSKSTCSLNAWSTQAYTMWAL